VDNIKIDLREIRWDGMDWIDVSQDREQWRPLANTVIKTSWFCFLGYLSDC
jgi:hypothetical protein